MFPVVGDVLHIMKRIEQEVISPLVPVNGHGAVFVHAEEKMAKQIKVKNRPTLFYSEKILSLQLEFNMKWHFKVEFKEGGQGVLKVNICTGFTSHSPNALTCAGSCRPVRWTPPHPDCAETAGSRPRRSDLKQHRKHTQSCPLVQTNKTHHNNKT